MKGDSMKLDRFLQPFILLIFLCISAALSAQDVQYNYDRDTNFSTYKTYQWVEREARGDQLMDRDIRRAIESQMEKQGLRRVETGGDVFLRYETAVDREKRFDAWTMGPRWSGMVRGNTSTVEVGTLVIKLFDPARKQLVWRGSVSKTLDIKKDPDKNYKNLEKAVAKLLRNFPPKSKS
jgi:uncharacterized protein DUF4136